MNHGDEFGKALSRCRKARGATQAELGQLVGLSQGVISHLERGHRAPTQEEVASIEVALDFPPRTLAVLSANARPADLFDRLWTLDHHGYARMRAAAIDLLVLRAVAGRRP